MNARPPKKNCKRYEFLGCFPLTAKCKHANVALEPRTGRQKAHVFIPALGVQSPGAGCPLKVAEEAWKWKWKLLSRVQLFATPWTGQNILERVAFPSPGDLPNPGTEPRSPALQADSLPAEPQEKPRILEWVAYPFFSGSSWPRSWTRVSCIAGGFFINWAIREVLAPGKHSSFYYLHSFAFSRMSYSCKHIVCKLHIGFFYRVICT